MSRSDSVSSYPKDTLRLLTRSSVSRSKGRFVNTGKGGRPDPSWAEGQKIPVATKWDEKWAGAPIQEPDTFYRNQQTFIIVGNDWRVNRFSLHSVFHFLGPFNPLRRFALFVITNQIFAWFLTTLIVINCALLVAIIPTPTHRMIVEYAFISIYSLELMLRVLARGFICHPFSWFRSPWAWLDLLIILTSPVAYLISYPHPFVYIQFFWGIRVFKIVPLIPELKESASFLLGICRSCYSLAFVSTLGVLTLSLLSMHLFPKPDVFCNPLRNCNATNNVESEMMSFQYPHWAVLTTLRFISQDSVYNLYYSIWDDFGEWYTIYMILQFVIGTWAIGTLAYGVVAIAFVHKLDQSSKQDNTEDDVVVPNRSNINEIRIPEKSNCFRTLFRTIVNSSLYEWPLVLFLLADIVFVWNIYLSPYHGLEWWPNLAPEWEQKIIIILTVDGFLRAFAFWDWEFYKSPRNIYDAIYFLAGVVYLITNSYLFSRGLWTTPGYIMAILQSRVLKLVPRWPTAQKLLWCMADAFYVNISFFVLLGFFCFFASYVGLVLYGHISAVEARWNFNDFPHSLMVIFRIVCGEWFTTLAQCAKTQGYVKCLGYFIPVFIIATFLIVVIGVSIVFSTLQRLTTMQEKKEPKQALFSSCWTHMCPASGLQCLLSQLSMTSHAELLSTPISRLDNPPMTFLARLRVFMDMKFYKWISITVIIVSSVSIIMDDSENTNDCAWRTVMLCTDLLFIAFFTCHLAAWSVSRGWRQCLLGHWIFDLILVAATMIDIVIFVSDDPEVQPINRIFNLRFFRPWMLFSRIERLGAVGATIWKQLNLLKRWILPCCLIWFLFIQLGSMLFNYLFYSCFEETKDLKIIWLDARNVSGKDHCLALNYTWSTIHNNFDSGVNGFRSLVHVATLSNGWTTIVERSLDIRGDELTPSPNNSFRNILFFIVFQLTGVLILVYVLIGVILRHLLEDKTFLDFMTVKQRANYEANRDTLDPVVYVWEYPKPGRMLQILYDFVSHAKFDTVIMSLVAVDVVTLTYALYNHNQSIGILLKIIYTILTGLFTVEVILKLLGWRMHFFRSVLNIVDLIVVIFSLIHLTWSFPLHPGVVRMLRLTRLLQYHTVLHILGTLRRFHTSFCSIRPALVNIILFYIIVSVTFGTVGMSMYKEYPPLGREFHENSTEEELYDEHCHRTPSTIIDTFNTFRGSSIIVFLSATFSGWSSRNVKDEDMCYIFNSYWFRFGFACFSFLMILDMYLVFILELLSQTSAAVERTAAKVAEIEKLTEEDCNGTDNLETRVKVQLSQLVISEETAGDLEETSESTPPLQTSSVESPRSPLPKDQWNQVQSSSTHRITANPKQTIVIHINEETAAARKQNQETITKISPITTLEHVPLDDETDLVVLANSWKNDVLI